MYSRRGPAHPRDLLRARPRRVRRDGAGRHHRVGEFHYLHHAPGGTPYDDPNAMGEALIAAAAEAGIRITLLDTAYLSAGFGQPPPNHHQLRFSDGTAEAWAERASTSSRTRDHARIGAAIHSVRAVPAGQLGTVARLGRGAAGPAARPPLRADRRERRLPGRPRLHPHPAARRPRRARPAHHRPSTPPTSPTRTSRCSATPAPARACAPPPNATSPTASAPPSPSSARARPLSLGSDSHAVIDLLEEARAMELERAAAHPHPRPLDGGRPAARRHRRRPRRPRLARRGHPRTGRARRLHHRRPGLRQHSGTAAPARRRDGRIRRLRRRRTAHGRRRPAHRPGRAAHARPRRARSPRRGHRRPARLTPPNPARTRTPAAHPDARRTAITNIASLVTNDPSLGDGSPLGLIQDAAVVIDGDRIAWTGDSSKAPATDNARRRRRPGGDPGLRRLPLPPASSRATAPQEFNARMSGRPYTAGGIRTTVAATRAATDDELCTPTSPATSREALRQGTTTFETKSGYGLTVEDEARALRIAAAHTDEVTYLGAHIVVARLRRRPGRLRRPGHRRDARRLRPARPLGRRLLREGRLRRRPGPRDPHRGQGQGPASRASTPTSSSYGPGVQLAVELGAASADHCTHLTDADVDALAPAATPSPRCCPAPSSPPAPTGPTPAACSTRAPPSRCPPTATRARPSPPPCRSASRSPYATWG